MPHYRDPWFRAALDAYSQTFDDLYEDFVNKHLFSLRVAYVVGYNPQRLLTYRPTGTFTVEGFSMRHVALFAGLGEPYALLHTPSWGEVSLSPLDDIENFREYVRMNTYWPKLSDIEPKEPRRFFIIDYEPPPAPPLKTAMIKPLRKPQPSYLAHDPTKRHRRKK
jgi:hypothetical protein